MITVVRTVEGKKEKKRIEWRDFDPSTDKVCGTPANLVFRIELIQRIRPSNSLWLHSQAQTCEARPFGLDMGFLALHARTPAAALDPEGCDREMFYVCAERRDGVVDHYLIPKQYCQAMPSSVSQLKKASAKLAAMLRLNENTEESNEDRALA